jgi:membrane protease YdiL (CAAX protease family)
MLTNQTAGYKAKAFEPRNLAFFFLIAFGLAWFPLFIFIFGILKPPSSIGEQFGTATGLIAIVLSAGPTIAAFVMTAITEGKPGVRALWGRFWNRNLSIKWLLVILLCYDALRLVANFIARTLDGQAYPILDLPNPPWMVIITFISAFIFNGLFEEFGWRGYALPRFQARWNALTSSLLLGAIWASWHIPAFFVPGLSLYQRNFWEWAPWIILSSILYTWFFNNTKGSVLAAALFHVMANFSMIVLPTKSSLWYYYGVLLAAVILIVIIFGARNLVRHRPEERT